MEKAILREEATEEKYSTVALNRKKYNLPITFEEFLTFLDSISRNQLRKAKDVTRKISKVLGKFTSTFSLQQSSLSLGLIEKIPIIW